VLPAMSAKERIKILGQYREVFRNRSGDGVQATGTLTEGHAGRTGIGQNGARTHLLRTISAARGQVKKATLSFVSASCSTVQVLANSQRGVKIWHHAHGLFAMFGFRCTISRERCGCLSV
jgi:hypothetical protein